MIVYDLEIFYKSEKTNFANELSRRSDYKKTSTLNIKFLSLLQNKLTLLKSMRNSSEIFDDVFKITDVRKLDFASNVKNLKKMFKNVMMRLNVRKFEFLKNIKSF